MSQPPRILHHRHRGEDVADIQNLLIANHYGHILGAHQADGHFGKKTRDAVKQFQRDHHLKVDGVVGEKTLAALTAATPHSGHLPGHMTTITGVQPVSMVAWTPEFLKPITPPSWMNAFPFSTPLATTKQEDKPLIVLDPGHGHYRDEKKHGKEIHDPGSVPKGSPVHEDEINLAVTLKLRDALEKKGFAVVLTRDHDDALLPTRFDARIDTGASKKVLHLSVHADAGSRHSEGLRVYTHPHWQKDKHAPSVQFAEALSTPGCCVVKNSDRMAMLNPKRMGNVPAALVEVGNMNNPQDLARMTSPSGQQSIADILADRIATHYNTTMCAATASLPKLPSPQSQDQLFASLTGLFSGAAFKPTRTL